MSMERRGVMGGFGTRGAVCLLLAGALLSAWSLFGPVAGQALAAEYEVRMPVAKTARIAPEGETSGGLQKSEALKTTPAQKSPKTAMGRAVEAAAASAAPPASTSAQTAAPAAQKAAKPAQAKPGAASASGSAPEAEPQKAQAGEQPVSSAKGASPVVVSAGAPIPVPGALPAAAVPAPVTKRAPKPEPTPRPEPKPKPEPAIDPKAMVLPAPQAASEKIPLPAQGLWVGDVQLEFRESSLVLRAATNGAVERVTWFNQTEPRKLALDLRGEWKKKGSHVLRFDTGPVKNVIVGEHADRLRLAILFREGAVQPSLDPKVETGPAGVTLTIPLAVRLAP